MNAWMNVQWILIYYFIKFIMFTHSRRPWAAAAPAILSKAGEGSLARKATAGRRSSCLWPGSSWQGTDTGKGWWAASRPSSTLANQQPPRPDRKPRDKLMGAGGYIQKRINEVSSAAVVITNFLYLWKCHKYWSVALLSLQQYWFNMNMEIY